MGSIGTLRILSGSPGPGSEEGPDGSGLRLDDGSTGSVAVRTLEGRLLVSGQGSFDVRIGRIPGLRRVVRPSAPVPTLLRQGQRLTLRAGAKTARVAYDPDRMLPVPLRIVAKASRFVAVPLWAVPAAGVAMAWLLGLGSIYYGGMPKDGMALELARHRGSNAYDRIDTSKEALLKERSPLFIEIAERRKAAKVEKANSAGGAAK